MTVIEKTYASAIARGVIALKNDASLKSVTEALVEPYHADVTRTEVVEFPPVPKPVVLDDKVKKALRDLPRVFAVVQPETRRTLTEEERVAVYEEQVALDAILDLLGKRREDIKTLVRHHMDVDAEERGIAVPRASVDHETGQVIVEATDRDRSGNYILCAPQNPERSQIPGTNMDWSREYRAGEVTVNASILEDLLEDGTITREVYLAMTREQRVFDETKAMEAAVHKTDLREGILTAIKAMTSISKPGTSLFTRKTK